MPCRTMLTLPFLVTLSQPSAYAQMESAGTRPPEHTELRSPSVSVPMDSWGGRPVVLAGINGEGPFRLLIDTGTTAAAILDDDLAKKLGIPTADETALHGSVGEGDLLEVETITIGDAEFSKVRAIRSDFSGFMPPGPKTPDGILGLPLFEDCLLTLDYPGSKVIFQLGELPPPNGETIEYSPDKQRDFGVTIELSVAGVTVKAHVDTGSPAFVALPISFEEKLPLADKPRVVGRARTPQGESEIRLATLDGTVKIGAHEFVRPKLEFNDLGPMVKYGCGNVGSRLLKDFALTLDQRNRRARFRHHNARDSADANVNPRQGHGP